MPGEVIRKGFIELIGGSIEAVTRKKDRERALAASTAGKEQAFHRLLKVLPYRLICLILAAVMLILIMDDERWRAPSPSGNVSRPVSVPSMLPPESIEHNPEEIGQLSPILPCVMSPCGFQCCRGLTATATASEDAGGLSLIPSWYIWYTKSRRSSLRAMNSSGVYPRQSAGTS